MWQKILVPHDFSRCASRALEQAIHLARTVSGRIVLLHVARLPHDLPPETRVTPPGEEGSLAISDLLKKGAERDLAAVMSPLLAEGTLVESMVRTSGEDLAVEILRVADETSADVIVMGTHGRSGLSRLFLGSVAENVVRRSRVPVVTVRTHESAAAKNREEGIAEDELSG
ncbi:MAG: universal stress protein [Polyangiaceae bacterium]